MSRALIIGASRGIGLGLVDVYLEDGWDVVVTTRDGRAPRLGVIGHRFDVRDADQLEDLIAALDAPLDTIIHNAGIMRAPRSELMEVNAAAPIRTVDALLRAGRLVDDGTVAIMTSQAGARRDRSGSLGDYGDSKAALNDAFRQIEPDWRDAGAIAVVIHPGWVRTDMGGQSAPLSVVESCRGVKHVLDGLEVADHGKFLTWDGRKHPW